MIIARLARLWQTDTFVVTNEPFSVFFSLILRRSLPLRWFSRPAKPEKYYESRTFLILPPSLKGIQKMFLRFWVYLIPFLFLSSLLPPSLQNLSCSILSLSCNQDRYSVAVYLFLKKSYTLHFSWRIIFNYSILQCFYSVCILFLNIFYLYNNISLLEFQNNW